MILLTNTVSHKMVNSAVSEAKRSNIKVARVHTSRDARKAYVSCVAAGLRAKDCVLDTVTRVQEGAENIRAKAK